LHAAHTQWGWTLSRDNQTVESYPYASRRILLGAFPHPSLLFARVAANNNPAIADLLWSGNTSQIQIHDRTYTWGDLYTALTDIAWHDQFSPVWIPAEVWRVYHQQHAKIPSVLSACTSLQLQQFLNNARCYNWFVTPREVHSLRELAVS